MAADRYSANLPTTIMQLLTEVKNNGERQHPATTVITNSKTCRLADICTGQL